MTYASGERQPIINITNGYFSWSAESESGAEFNQCPSIGPDGFDEQSQSSSGSSKTLDLSAIDLKIPQVLFIYLPIERISPDGVLLVLHIFERLITSICRVFLLVLSERLVQAKAHY